MHCNGEDSYLFVNGKEVINFKVKDSEIIENSLCLGNISENFSIDNTIKTGLYGYVYDFSVDYKTIEIYDTLDIHRHLMEKDNII